MIHEFPYSDFHEMNLDWLLHEVNKLKQSMHDFKIANALHIEGAWDITKAYQAYSIVTNANLGYISTQAVPAGITLNNSDYWMNIADFTALYADLGQRVSTLEGNTSYIYSVLADNQIIKSKYAIWLGDSYTAAGSLGADIDKRFSTLVTNRLGLTEKNYAVGGNGIINGNSNYTVQMQSAINDFTNNNLDKNAVKYIFISSCRNDTNYGTRNDIRTAMNNIIGTLTAEFVNAKIVIIPLLWDWKTVYLNSRLLDYIAEIHLSAELYGNKVIVIDYGYEWLMGRADMVLYENGGDVHPTVAGHKVISNHIYSAIMGNNYRRYEFAQFTPTTLNGIGDFSGFYEVRDGEINFNFEFTVNGGSDITTGTVFELDINSIYFSNFFFTHASANNIYFDIISRDMTSTTEPVCKAVLESYCSKTDTTTGAYVAKVKLYGNGKLTNSHKYYARLKIPYGIVNYPTW